MRDKQLFNDFIFGFIWLLMFLALVIISAIISFIVYLSVVLPSQQRMDKFTPTTCTVLNNTCIKNTTIIVNSTTDCFAYLQFGDPKENFKPIFVKLLVPFRKINSKFICYYKILSDKIELLQKSWIEWDTFRFLIFGFFTGGLLFDCIVSLILISTIYGLLKALKSILQ